MSHGDHVPDLGQPNGIATLGADSKHPVAQQRVFTPATPSTAGQAGVLPAPQAGQVGVDWVPNGNGVWSKSQDTLPPAIQALAQERPGAFFAGLTIYLYPAQGSVVSQEIQYTRVFLTEGLVLDRGEAYISSGSNNRFVRVGLYSQADPTDPTGVPVTKLKQTPALNTSGLSETFWPGIYEGGSYTVPATGYYWVAFVGDNQNIKIAVTAASYRAGFLPVWRETTTGLVLPATVGTITNPQSAVAYASTVEEGAL